MTGQHTARNRMWHVIPPYGFPWARMREPAYESNLPRGTPTLAAAHYGFDYAPPRNQPPQVQARGDKGVDLFTAQALNFIEQHRGRPFFLYLSHHTIHGPVLARKRRRGRFWTA